MSYYVDVHAHLTDEAFAQDLPDVVQRAWDAGLRSIVVNGLDPLSNLKAFELKKSYPHIIKCAMGIYPVHAVNHLLPKNFHLPIDHFDVKEAIAQIKHFASSGLIDGIGECGLDGYHLDASTFSAQEEVFRELIEVAKNFDLPLIVHTRKLEQRALDILAEHQASRVDLHCFSGKLRLALQASETFGWHFSIPANAERSESFSKMLECLPLVSILTETDAPYLSPEKGSRNEPQNVVRTASHMAKRRGLTQDQARALICDNYKRLFSLT